jgi:hypothetical protein
MPVSKQTARVSRPRARNLDGALTFPFPDNLCNTDPADTARAGAVKPLPNSNVAAVGVISVHPLQRTLPLAVALDAPKLETLAMVTIEHVTGRPLSDTKITITSEEAPPRSTNCGPKTSHVALPRADMPTMYHTLLENGCYPTEELFATSLVHVEAWSAYNLADMMTRALQNNRLSSTRSPHDVRQWLSVAGIELRLDSKLPLNTDGWWAPERDRAHGGAAHNFAPIPNAGPGEPSCLEPSEEYKVTCGHYQLVEAACLVPPDEASRAPKRARNILSS